MMQRMRLFSSGQSSNAVSADQQSDFQAALQAITQPKLMLVDSHFSALQTSAVKAKEEMKKAMSGMIVMGGDNSDMMQAYNTAVSIFIDELYRYYDNVIKDLTKTANVDKKMSDMFCHDRETLYKVKFDNSRVIGKIDMALRIAEVDTAEIKTQINADAIRDLHRLNRPHAGCVMM